MSILKDTGIILENIKDEQAKQAIILLFNIIENSAAEIKKLKQENQELKDENNRLKGEQGKPDIKPKNQQQNKDISSNKERKISSNKKKRKSKTKKKNIQIDRTEKCKIDKEKLPSDAVFKGYQDVVVQDIKIEKDNILFRKETYYSSLEKKTYMADLPPGYKGEYGPTLKAIVIIQKYLCGTPESKILDLLKNYGIKQISSSTISNILTKDKDEFHEEKADVFKAGLESTQYQHIDDTKARVNGENRHVQILCNPLYTAFFTTKRKTRLTILDVLTDYQERSYLFDFEAVELLKKMKISKKIIRVFESLEKKEMLKTEEAKALIKSHIPNIGKNQEVRVLEAGAISAYHKQRGYPIVQILVCDNAPQFKLLTEELALCWVHDGRHYKKLSPVITYHQELLDDFLEEYWQFYRKLLEYKINPSEEKSLQLTEEFDRLFSKKTNYESLNKRITKTKEKKKELLLALKYPEIPLHNNAAELAARIQVRIRDISLQTRTEEGTQVKDTFLTIVQTAKKLRVNAYDYIIDRISKKYELPSLSFLIRQKSTTLSL